MKVKKQKKTNFGFFPAQSSPVQFGSPYVAYWVSNLHISLWQTSCHLSVCIQQPAVAILNLTKTEPLPGHNRPDDRVQSQEWFLFFIGCKKKKIW